MRKFSPSVRARPPRLATQIPCQVVRLSDFRLVADRILDLSDSGMLVSPAEPVLTGEALLVTFQAPHWGRWIDAEAVVRRVVHGRRPTDSCRQMGLTYDVLDPRTRWVLEQAMRWMPPAPPRGRPGRRGVQAAVRRLAASSSRIAREHAP
jgi:hypothetical protein